MGTIHCANGRSAEWPTLALIAACYAVWGLATAEAQSLGPWLAAPLITLSLALHSSLQHEALHGHPFADRRLNAALVFPALGLFVPYERFRDTHIAHHRDETLTDPYDDPESNYLDPAVWARLSRPMRRVYRVNATLLGRMLIGPVIGMAHFLAADVRRRDDPAVRRAWALHALGLVPVVAWLALAGGVGAGAYLACAYAALGVLRIRTFLEHRAHEIADARTVVVEDRGPLAFLFLNNNLHAVHHAHPGAPWYRLPALYREARDTVLEMNRGYVYPSYAAVFRRHLVRAKDPVPHPLRPRW